MIMTMMMMKHLLRVLGQSHAAPPSSLPPACRFIGLVHFGVEFGDGLRDRFRAVLPERWIRSDQLLFQGRGLGV